MTDKPRMRRLPAQSTEQARQLLADDPDDMDEYWLARIIDEVRANALADTYTREEMREACRNNYAAARAEALEEAARACEAYAVQAEEDGKTDKADYSANINTARRLMFLIRALKEKPSSTDEPSAD